MPGTLNPGPRRGGRQPIEERENGVVEEIVAVSGHHMPGPGHVGELGVRHDLQEPAGPLLAEQVADPPAYQEHRDGEAARRRLEPVGVHDRRPRLVRGAPVPADEAGVPVPGPTTVRAPAQVLLQAGEVAGPGPVGVVGRYGVGRLLEAAEAALHVLAHEVPDPFGTGRLDPGGHVDQYEAGGERFRRLGERHQRRHPPKRRADQHGWRFELGGQRPDVGREGVEPVVTVLGPVALTVTAEVDGQGPPSPLPQQPPGRTPGMARLAATVQQHHRPRPGRPEGVGTQPDAAGAGKLHRLAHRLSMAEPVHGPHAGPAPGSTREVGGFPPPGRCGPPPLGIPWTGWQSDQQGQPDLGGCGRRTGTGRRPWPPSGGPRPRAISPCWSSRSAWTLPSRPATWTSWTACWQTSPGPAATAPGPPPGRRGPSGARGGPPDCPARSCDLRWRCWPCSWPW